MYEKVRVGTSILIMKAHKFGWYSTRDTITSLDTSNIEESSDITREMTLKTHGEFVRTEGALESFHKYL